MTIRIDVDVSAAIATAARTAWPHECCGVALGPIGQPGAITRFVPLNNVSAHPARAFELDPLEHLKLLRAAPADGLEQRAIVHSHPRGGGRPSSLDVEHAALWPGVVWIIVPVTAEDAAVAAAWSFVDGAPHGVALSPLAPSAMANGATAPRPAS